MQPQRTEPPSAPDNKAMPKVNVPPMNARPILGTPVSEEKPTPALEHKKDGFVWDFKFSLGLIVLVIAVNTVLAMTLGKSASLSDSSARQIFADSEERTIPLQKSAAGLSALSPAAGSPAKAASQGTRTYISPEEKRLLLKYLETPPDRQKTEEQTAPAQPITQP